MPVCQAHLEPGGKLPWSPVYPGLFLISCAPYRAAVVSRAVILNDSSYSLHVFPKGQGRWARLWEIPRGGWLEIVTDSLLIAYEFSYSMGKERATAAVCGAGKSHPWPQSPVSELLLTPVLAEPWALGAVRLWLMETFLFLMMGTWLMQAAFILYKSVSGYPWEDDDSMFVTTSFCRHLVISALCLLGIYSFASFWYRHCSPSLKLRGSKKAPDPESSSRPLPRWLREAEQLEKDQRALLLAKGPACGRAQST
uniref:LOW QUALITY PROTEIN: transmembrane epididymal protein 1A n=1 Tax=Jaculus jaculus TaxID=51337 RepID=UPI001E1B17B3|nr:LOW QUALITY PROTEIN: transmembrane epididymal protein 1A [Jaculus jaculus]